MSRQPTVRYQQPPGLASPFLLSPFCASPSAASPLIYTTDDHVAGVARNLTARRCQRRAGVVENFNFFEWTDDFVHLRQFDPAVAAAGAHDGVRLWGVI